MLHIKKQESQQGPCQCYMSGRGIGLRWQLEEEGDIRQSQPAGQGGSFSGTGKVGNPCSSSDSVLSRGFSQLQLWPEMNGLHMHSVHL